SLLSFINSLENFNSLTRLNLAYCDLSGSVLLSLLSALKTTLSSQLEWLDLEGNHLTNDAVKTLCSSLLFGSDTQNNQTNKEETSRVTNHTQQSWAFSF